MIVWLILFLLVVGISFLLAFMSMKDYHEIPQKSNLEYALFLIRQPSLINAELLQSIRETLAKKGLVISLERLFKGSESALCIFAPKEILVNYPGLNLLEIEDYSSDFNNENSIVWEVESGNLNNLFGDLPELSMNELFSCQVIISGKQIQIRAGIFARDLARRQQFIIGKLPRPFSNDQMIGFLQKRVMDKETAKSLSLKLLAQFLLLQPRP